jgi:DNA (cytosine-5)-methyltransferase 1
MELFAGAGGGIYGALLLGHTPVCAVEIVAKNRELLLQRQRDGVFPRFPVWDDVRTFEGLPWRGVVDVVSGGFPCTDISAAGKGAGIDGEQSGLWREMARIVREVRPRYVFVENSPMLITRGLGRVLGDLAAIGYDCRWTCLSAADCGAPHERDRIWILGADSNGPGLGAGRRSELCSKRQTRNDVVSVREDGSDTTSERREEEREHRRDESEERSCRVCAADSWKWPAQSGICGVATRMADWRHRIFALGNGQVPRVHAAAWRMLSGE